MTEMLNSKVMLNANEYGALVSWSFNEGCGAAKSSSLVNRLNEGQNPKTVIASELPKWVYGTVGGQSVVLQGLVTRRKAEVKLAETASSNKALPVKC
jgi:lysozyme